MIEKVLVPVLGESITEATVAKWLKNEGDSVKADEPIIELETDKVNLEVPSPINGVISEINAKDGDIVEVGSLLGSIEDTEIQQDKKIEIEKNNVVSLDAEKKKEPIKIFEEVKEIEEKPLILSNEFNR